MVMTKLNCAMVIVLGNQEERGAYQKNKRDLTLCVIHATLWGGEGGKTMSNVDKKMYHW